MTSEPLLSILVATRNRQTYAFELVKDVLSWADRRIELVVEDNSEAPFLASLLEPYLDDVRLRYRYNAEPISSIENFNNAIEASSGRFVCLIGDDDGLHSEVLSAVEWAEREGIDCLAGSVAHEYIWPTPSDSQSERPGSLSLPSFSGRVTLKSGKVDLRALLSRGGTQYLELGLPRLYHGFVKRSILSLMKKSRGYYLGGLSPDIYAAVSFSQLAQKTALIEYPLTIPGVCHLSGTSIEGKQSRCSTNIRDAPHFRCREWYQFNPKLPPFYCVDAIWAESACTALGDLGQGNAWGRASIFTLSAYIFRCQPQLRGPLLDWLVQARFARSRSSALVGLFVGYMSHPLVTDLRRATRKLNRLMGLSRMTVLEGLANIADARRAVESATREAATLQTPWAKALTPETTL